MIKEERRPDQWKVLVLDELTTKLLSAAATMSEVMTHRIALIENVEKSRAPMEELEAIYFLSPTTKSIRHLVADFDGKQLYKCKDECVQI